MRFAVISDIHGNLDALNAVLAEIERLGISDIVNLGDCFGGPLDARGTAERLIPLNFPTVSGNHDRWLVERRGEDMPLWERWIIDEMTEAHLDWVRALPATLSWHGVLLCHGTPASDEENWLDRRGPEARLVARDLAGVTARLPKDVKEAVVLCGHTHCPRTVRVPNGPLIVNPGAVGCPAYHDGRSDPPFLQETGAPDARFAVLERAGGAWRTALHAVPYDPSRMIALAEAKGADSWVRALRTGWVT